MRNSFIYIILLLMISTVEESFAQVQTNATLNWNKLPSIPDPVGFAGSFAGVSNGTLLVAGGANFPDGGAPWTGSVKVWSDRVFALESASGVWKEIGKLPHKLGYGVSITYKNSLILLGGSNEQGHVATVSRIEYKNKGLQITSLPSLPEAVANTCGVLVGDVIYVLGGIKKPDSKVAGSNFWALDLSAKKMEWKILPTWPGAARMLSVAGTQNGDVYLFSGVELVNGDRKYLIDAYRFEPKSGWHKIAALPSSVTAAPSPAFANNGNLLIFGGDDGIEAPNAAKLREKHPGFSTKVLSYSPSKNKWNLAGAIFTDKKEDAVTNPNGSIWAPVTTTLTVWNGNVILPGGEVRPATRTPNVLMASPIKNNNSNHH
jgi:N-acetylneuraminate epimerase